MKTFLSCLSHYILDQELEQEEVFKVNNLRKLRKSRGLTQFELAKLCNINPSDISKIENGIFLKPYKKWITSLTAVLEVSEDELFSADDEKNQLENSFRGEA